MTNTPLKQTQSPVSKYAVQLVDVVLRKLEFRVADEKLDDFSTQVIYRRDSTLIASSDQGFEATLSLDMVFAEEEGKPSPFTARFVLSGHYTHKPELPTGLRDYFVNINGPILLWPYMRELVSSITVRAGFPPLLLETLDVQRVVAEDRARLTEHSEQ